MRQSRATLQRATADLQADLEARIREGFLARLKRWLLTDPELRRRLDAAYQAKSALALYEGDK